MAGSSFTLSAQQLLDGIPGPAYVVDGESRFLLVGRRNWSRQLGDAPGQPDADALIGRNLFEFIRGGKVQGLYRRILEQLRDDPALSFALLYRCDAPGVMREFRMTVSAVVGAESRGVLFCSHLMRQAQRPPIPLFEYRALAALGDDPTVPILAICSMCHRVKPQPGDEGDPRNWIEPEQYYRSGGSSRVSLSHGVCPSCYQRFMSEAEIVPVAAPEAS